MNKDRLTIADVVSRCLKLRCPACGGASIVKRPFHIANDCPACGVSFKREEGFFVGAILANVVITDGVIVCLYLLSLPLLSNHYDLVLGILFATGIAFPIAFYHHSWSIWLAFDHLIESLPKAR
jgi:uncharacterized protein (DUF983 family)